MELVDKTDKLTQRKIDRQIYREKKTIWIRMERDCNKKNEKEILV
jgi:transketolase C-terminal domain/subunit